MIKDILKRAAAVVAASFMGTLGAGALVNIQVWQAGLIAAALGLATVIEGLSRSYLEDGKLTKEEIDQAFAEFNKGKSKD
jgi:hypothetical protein